MLRFTKPISRKHERQRMRRGAWLTLSSDAPPTQCVVWDFSEGGCRLAAPHAVKLPEVFFLKMSPDATVRYACRVVWQREAYVGVEFIAAAGAEQLAEAAECKAAPRPLYLNNNRDAFRPGKPKAKPESSAGAVKAKPAKRPRFNIQLY